MQPMQIRCGTCGQEWTATTEEQAYQPCERCQKAAAEGRPYFPDAALPKGLREVLKQADAQEEYWQLSYRHGMAAIALRQAEQEAELEPDLESRIALLEAQEAYADVETAWQAFSLAHDGETFKAFRPEDIEAAFSSDIKPLFEI